MAYIATESSPGIVFSFSYSVRCCYRCTRKALHMCCTSITHGIGGSANAVVPIKAHCHYKDNLMVSDLCIWHKWQKTFEIGGREGVGHDYNTQ